MPELVPVKRALLSVSDKTNLVPFARALAERGVEIISTGGTASALREAGIAVIPVSEVTGSPEILSGRVKTLHPGIHGAILARRGDAEHEAQLREHGITPIDLVCVNLYPFERTVAQPGVTRAEAVEQIDIGGPCMVRASAKNADGVAIVTDPEQYAYVLDDLESHGGATSAGLRMRLAREAFARTSAYDAAIVGYLSGDQEDGGPLPGTLRIEAAKVADLRYGENPHQSAALYRDARGSAGTVVGATQLHGKALSYNNIADAAAALELVRDCKRLRPGSVPAAVIKHANACGAAVAPACAPAVAAALAGDPLAAFGGIMAVAGRVDLGAAQLCCADDVFLEVIVAESFADDALEALTARWKNIRLLAAGPEVGRPGRLQFRSIPGGVLAQETDSAAIDPNAWSVGAGGAVDAGRRADAAVVWTVCKHLKSNAVCIGGADAASGVVSIFGVGAGLVDRVSACRLAVEKAGARALGAIAASDAFFPFADGPALLVDAGVSTIVQPGGSRRDAETLELCEKAGVTCLLTGIRHFRH
ncbi:MAG: bifunctional phosphoribosylaminoimidazolecarboxamide formyltransferase/IMP cyclohydrolase [Phycisphaeraceae bacterium]|nr:bifunctional phosphoribosylaminoimidazolecarboxamide formyltransferase/IMP cyclohydrolase [Phycisphaeraceae bacterium]MCB9847467.1 bifunctional phosphoribosylaminoimidazolecarboxamide formyltransferase/IMP cyclohydrolase [Phycisphaeraceae bacterium]